MSAKKAFVRSHRLASGYTSSQGLVATVESLKDALGAEPRPGPSAA